MAVHGLKVSLVDHSVLASGEGADELNRRKSRMVSSPNLSSSKLCRHALVTALNSVENACRQFVLQREPQRLGSFYLLNESILSPRQPVGQRESLFIDRRCSRTVCQLATDSSLNTAVTNDAVARIADSENIDGRDDLNTGHHNDHAGIRSSTLQSENGSESEDCLVPGKPWLVNPRRTPVSRVPFHNGLPSLRNGNVKEMQQAALDELPVSDALGSQDESDKRENEGESILASSEDESEDSRMCGGRRHWPKMKADGENGVRGPTSHARWFPYIDEFDLGLAKPLDSTEVLQMLEPFLVEGRKLRIAEVVAARTYQVVPVVEGLADLGNVAAVCRTSEAFGLQSIQVVTNEKRKIYKDNRSISMGTDKWLDVELWQSTSRCFEALRARGYRIAVTHISPDTIPIYDLDWTIPTAVVFGNEHRGATPEALEASDVRIGIPMCGMVDSFNISVAAAITLHHAVRDRVHRQGFHGDLTEEEQRILAAEFYMRSNRHTKSIIEQLLYQKGVTLGQKANALESFLAKCSPGPS